MAKKQKALPNLIDRTNRPILRYFQMNKLPLRPGSLDVFDMPSRVAGTLFYPDGRVVRGER